MNSLLPTNERGAPVVTDTPADAEGPASFPPAGARPSIVPPQAGGLDCAWAVDQYYVPLFRFGYRLARNESDAADLTQETYQILYKKGAEIRDVTKVKSWLFTTLYRLFLHRRKREVRFPTAPLEAAEYDLPTVRSSQESQHDGALTLACLQRLDEVHRVPLKMFYLEDRSYKEIAAVLGVPIGTVMSRIYRGKNALRRMLEIPLPAPGDGAKPGPGWPDRAATILSLVPEPAEAS